MISSNYVLNETNKNSNDFSDTLVKIAEKRTGIDHGRACYIIWPNRRLLRSSPLRTNNAYL